MTAKIAQKVVEVFGEERLHKAPYDAIKNWNIPPSSREFLTAIGIPDEPSLLTYFYMAHEQLSRLSVEFSLIQTIAAPAKGLKPFGKDACGFLCLDEQNASGRVISVAPQRKIPRYFVNTNVELLAYSLALYRDACDRSMGLQEPAWTQIAFALDRELRKADPEAFVAERDDLSWWAPVTEQMKDGLM